MSLWAKGQAHQVVRPEIGDGKIGAVVHGRLETMRRSEVNEYLDVWFWSVLDLWWRWRMFQALPFSGGWAEQPAHLIAAIEEAESAYKAVQSGGR